MRFPTVPVQVDAKVPESSGAESWRVPAGMADEVLEGSGAGRQQSSGGLLQMVDEVPKGCAAVSTQVCGGFRCRWLIKYWRVRVQIATKVPEGSDADR